MSGDSFFTWSRRVPPGIGEGLSTASGHGFPSTGESEPLPATSKRAASHLVIGVTEHARLHSLQELDAGRVGAHQLLDVDAISPTSSS